MWLVEEDPITQIKARKLDKLKEVVSQNELNPVSNLVS